MIEDEVQFSIYKIDKELVINELDGLSDDSSCKQVLDKLTFYIECCVKKSGIGKDYSNRKDYDDFTVLYLNSVREPIWKNLIRGMFGDKEMEVFNTSSSYLIFTIIENTIFAMTGGRGSNYISKFIEKNFGLYLLPKIIDKDNPVLKKIVENNTSGNNFSTQRVTKNATSVLSEEKISSIYKELSICVSTTLARDLGIDLEESKRLISISSGDSFVIKKSLSLSDLKKVLNTIITISKRNDKFVLNYFVPCEKKRKKSSDLDNIMYNLIANNQVNTFEIIAEDVEQYFSSYTYVLQNDNDILIQDEEEIKFNRVYEKMLELNKGKLSINFVKNFLKNSYIYTLDSNGIKQIYDKRLYDMLRGSVEQEKESFYFLNGRWYAFEDSYFNMLDEMYKKIINKNNELYDTLNINRFNILTCNSNISEDAYNMSFENNDKVIVAHKSFLKNVEIADLIFWDDNYLFLMCNKSVFSGPGTRDLSNQIEMSYSILAHILDAQINQIDLYYDKLRDSEKEKLDKKYFQTLFKEKKIVYIAGYSEGFSDKTKSIYCKYLIKELYQKINTDKFQLLIMNYKK